jgi:enamine deaminase RidA (YjgF/YER057c/UK114 family)
MSKPSKIAVKEADGPNGEHTYHHRSKPAGSPYLSNMIVSGKTVYLAGCIGIGENNALVPGGVGPETTQALKEAAKRLAFIGLDLSDGKFLVSNRPCSLAVVSVTIYINNYAENFSGLQKVGRWPLNQKPDVAGISRSVPHRLASARPLRHWSGGSAPRRCRRVLHHCRYTRLVLPRLICPIGVL